MQYYLYVVSRREECPVKVLEEVLFQIISLHGTKVVETSDLVELFTDVRFEFLGNTNDGCMDAAGAHFLNELVGCFH